MKKADVLDLIKYHFENKETEFRNQAIAIARYFDKTGDSQLALNHVDLPLKEKTIIRIVLQ